MFAPDANAVIGLHAPHTPIVDQADNVAFSDIIPNQLRIQGLKTSSTTSNYVLFTMRSVISQSYSTVCKYVSSTILALSTLMLKPLPEPLERNILGSLSMHHLFNFLYIFPNHKITLKLLLRKDVSLFDQD